MSPCVHVEKTRSMELGACSRFELEKQDCSDSSSALYEEAGAGTRWKKRSCVVNTGVQGEVIQENVMIA